jgi:hypothetical protein
MTYSLRKDKHKNKNGNNENQADEVVPHPGMMAAADVEAAD